jgi:hypothetical protein
MINSDIALFKDPMIEDSRWMNLSKCKKDSKVREIRPIEKYMFSVRYPASHLSKKDHYFETPQGTVNRSPSKINNRKSPKI